MIGSPTLTALNELMLETHAGQAHFVVPNAQHTCRECIHWLNQQGNRTKAGLLKPARCRQAAIRSQKPLPPVPHNARECRHFEAALRPPSP